MLKKIGFAVVAVAFVVALLSGANADTHRWLGGVTTADTATDTTITRAGSIPGNNDKVAIWNPDAACWITIVGQNSTTIYLPADGDLQIFEVGFVTSVVIDKLGVQRVGVYFLGN